MSGDIMGPGEEYTIFYIGTPIVTLPKKINLGCAQELQNNNYKYVQGDQ